MNTNEIETGIVGNDNANTATVTVGKDTYTVNVNAAGDVDTAGYMRTLETARAERDNANAACKGAEKNAAEAAKTAAELKKAKTAATRKYNAAKKNGTANAAELKTELDAAISAYSDAENAANAAELKKVESFEAWTAAKTVYMDAETAYNNAERVKNHVLKMSQRVAADKYAENVKTAKMTTDIDAFAELLPEFSDETLKQLKTANANTQKRKRSKVAAYRWQLGGKNPITETAYKKLIHDYPQYAETAVLVTKTETDKKTGNPVEVKTYKNSEAILNVSAENVTALVRILKHNTELDGKTRDNFGVAYSQYAAAVAAYHAAILSGDENAEREQRAKMQEHNAELQNVKKQIERGIDAVSDAETVAGAIIAAAEHDLKKRIERVRSETDFLGSKIHAVNAELETRAENAERAKIDGVNAKHKTNFRGLTVWDVAEIPE